MGKIFDSRAAKAGSVLALGVLLLSGCETSAPVEETPPVATPMTDAAEETYKNLPREHDGTLTGFSELVRTNAEATKEYTTDTKGWSPQNLTITIDGVELACSDLTSYNEIEFIETFESDPEAARALPGAGCAAGSDIMGAFITYNEDIEKLANSDLVPSGMRPLTAGGLILSVSERLLEAKDNGEQTRDQVITEMLEDYALAPWEGPGPASEGDQEGYTLMEEFFERSQIEVYDVTDLEGFIGDGGAQEPTAPTGPSAGNADEPLFDYEDGNLFDLINADMMEMELLSDYTVNFLGNDITCATYATDGVACGTAYQVAFQGAGYYNDRVHGGALERGAALSEDASFSLLFQILLYGATSGDFNFAKYSSDELINDVKFYTGDQVITRDDVLAVAQTLGIDTRYPEVFLAN